MIDDGLTPGGDLLPEDPAEVVLGAVKFDALSPTGFEEFRFALMSETGFVNVDWREGTPKESSPADRGRDIVAQLERHDVDVHRAPVIDAHHHVWGWEILEAEWTRRTPLLRRPFSLSELSADLDRFHIAATVLVQAEATPAETRRLLTLAASSDLVHGVVGWVDLTDSSCPDSIDELSDRSTATAALVGLRHAVCDETDPRWLQRADVQRSLRAVADRGLTFDLLVTSDQLDGAADLARANPNLRLIVDHIGSPHMSATDFDADWSSAMSRLAAFSNVSVKLSGLLSETRPEHTTAMFQKYVEPVLEVYGADRMMYGSDWPVCLLGGSYEDTISLAHAVTATLSAAEQDAIFGTTALAWYQIPLAIHKGHKNQAPD